MSGVMAHPKGVVGWLAAEWTALTSGGLSRWALSLLDPADGERILEVGFGAGADLARLARAVGAKGFVGGVDVSALMVQSAARRSKAFIKEGRVILQQAGATDLPYTDGSFGAAYSLNSAQFWPDLPRGLAEIARVLRPGGRVVVAVRPATEEEVERWRERLIRGLLEAGFGEVVGETGPGAAAGMGRKPP
jgi:ubiquinone/menaquinone biosynthesis C-methylase UbiE